MTEYALGEQASSRPLVFVVHETWSWPSEARREWLLCRKHLPPPLLVLELKLPDFLGTAGNSLLITNFASLPPVLYEDICVFADIRRAPFGFLFILWLCCQRSLSAEGLPTQELSALLTCGCFWGVLLRVLVCPGTVLGV